MSLHQKTSTWDALSWSSSSAALGLDEFTSTGAAGPPPPTHRRGVSMPPTTAEQQDQFSSVTTTTTASAAIGLPPIRYEDFVGRPRLGHRARGTLGSWADGDYASTVPTPSPPLPLSSTTASAALVGGGAEKKSAPLFDDIIPLAAAAQPPPPRIEDVAAVATHRRGGSNPFVQGDGLFSFPSVLSESLVDSTSPSRPQHRRSVTFQGTPSHSYASELSSHESVSRLGQQPQQQQQPPPPQQLQQPQQHQPPSSSGVSSAEHEGNHHSKNFNSVDPLYPNVQPQPQQQQFWGMMPNPVFTAQQSQQQQQQQYFHDFIPAPHEHQQQQHQQHRMHSSQMMFSPSPLVVNNGTDSSLQIQMQMQQALIVQQQQWLLAMQQQQQQQQFQGAGAPPMVMHHAKPQINVTGMRRHLHQEMNVGFPVGNVSPVTRYAGNKHVGSMQAGISEIDPVLALYKSTGRRPKIEQLQGRVFAFASDAHGSRFLQYQMELARPEEKDAIVMEVIPHAVQLMHDTFGNYVIQNFLEHATPQSRRALCESMRGSMLALSIQPHGCRVVQRALDVVDIDQRNLLLEELLVPRGNVLQAARNTHATHVLQKTVSILRRDAAAEANGNTKVEGSIALVRAMEKAIADDIVQLLVHPHAYRLVLNVMGDCDRNRSVHIARAIDVVCENRDVLSVDQHGNFMLQHMLDNKEADNVLDFVHERLVELSQHKFGSHLVEKCFQVASNERCASLVEEMIRPTSERNISATRKLRAAGAMDWEGSDSPVLALMMDPYANFVVQKCFDRVQDESLKKEIVDLVQGHADLLGRFTYGRHILAHVNSSQFSQQQTSSSVMMMPPPPPQIPHQRTFVPRHAPQYRN